MCCAPGCSAASSTRPAGGSSGCGRRSASSTTARRAARARSRRADPGHGAPALRDLSPDRLRAEQVVRHFAREGLRWPRRLYTGRRAPARSSSRRWSTAACSTSSTIRATPARSCTAARASARWSSPARRAIAASRGPSGRSSCPMPIRATSRWEEFETNQATLLANAHGYGPDRRRSPAREGVALLQGLVICGRCGDRMTVRYTVRRGHPGARLRSASAEGIARAAAALSDASPARGSMTRWPRSSSTR